MSDCCPLSAPSVDLVTRQTWRASIAEGRSADVVCEDLRPVRTSGSLLVPPPILSIIKHHIPPTHTLPSYIVRRMAPHTIYLLAPPARTCLSDDCVTIRVLYE